VEELARDASIPVINALSDLHHPLQALADFMILQEAFQRQDLAGMEIAFVGDGNNVSHSMMIMAANLGCHFRMASPKGYGIKPEIRAAVAEIADRTGSRILYTEDPQEACAGAEVISTDTWVSMGDEADAAARIEAFQGYQVTEKMASGAKPGWKFLHCLPRKKYEVDDEVFYNPKRSLVWDEAENRMWTVMSVSLALLRGKI